MQPFAWMGLRSLAEHSDAIPVFIIAISTFATLLHCISNWHHVCDPRWPQHSEVEKSCSSQDPNGRAPNILSVSDRSSLSKATRGVCVPMVVAVGGICLGGFKSPPLASVSLATILRSTCLRLFFEPFRRLHPRLHLVGTLRRECPFIVGRSRLRIDRAGPRWRWLVITPS